MPRFYLADALQPGQNISLPENVIRHLQVLRVREGEEITLFNGNGHSYPTRLLSLAKRQAVAEVLSEQTVDNESPLAISLIQAVSSGERMDFTLQ